MKVNARHCGVLQIEGIAVAQISKKRARELKQDDKFKKATMHAFENVSNRLEGQGRTILYGIGALLAVAILAGIYSWWSGRRADEARLALGKAIEIAEAPVSPSPLPNAATLSFPTERERAEKAVKEFQSVAAKYGDPYRELARFFAAANLYDVDPARSVSELEALSKSGNDEVAARAKFALAQAREAGGQYDAAAALYNELIKDKDSIVAPDTINLRLASVYEKQGKRDEAADILFRMVDAARKTQGKDGKPAPQSAAAREAADKLESLNPTRYSQLPPEPRTSDLPF